MEKTTKLKISITATILVIGGLSAAGIAMRTDSGSAVSAVPATAPAQKAPVRTAPQPTSEVSAPVIVSGDNDDALVEAEDGEEAEGSDAPGEE